MIKSEMSQIILSYLHIPIYWIRDIAGITIFAMKMVYLVIYSYVLKRNAAIILFVSRNKRCITDHASKEILGQCIKISHRFYKPKKKYISTEMMKVSAINRSAGILCNLMCKLLPLKNSVIFIWGYADIEIFGQKIETKIPIYRLEDPLFGYLATENKSEFGYLIEEDFLYFDGNKETKIEKLLEQYPSGDWQKNQFNKQFIDYYKGSSLKKFTQINAPLDQKLTSHDAVIVGQCVGDMAWLATKSLVSNNVQLVDYMLKNVKIDGNFYYKPHPFNKLNTTELRTIQRDYPNCNLLKQEISFPTIIKTGAIICVNTSGAGLEAAVRGSRVKTCGVSFYSNWGFTEDAIQVKQRSNNLTPEDVFYVFNCKYTVYANRFTNKRISTQEMYLEVTANQQ